MSFRKTQLHPIVALAVWMSLSTLVLEGAAQKLPRTLQARHEWRGLGSCLSPFPGMLKNPQPVFRAYAPAGVVTLPRNG
jgi:hypothetical protein